MVREGLLVASQFHYIDLSGSGECLAVDELLGQHPEGRPQVLTARHSGPHLESAVSEALFADQFGRSEVVVPLGKGQRRRSEHKQTVFHPNVVTGIGVTLGLVVAPGYRLGKNVT